MVENLYKLRLINTSRGVSNVSITPICILPTHVYNYSINIGSIFLIFWHTPSPPSVGMSRCRHLFAYIFSKWFAFSKFSMPSQKYDMNNGIRIIFIKIIIIKINAIKIYIKNTNFITI